MAQPQHQQLPLPSAPPPRPYSPAQLSPALPNSQAPYSGNPPPKRQRTSPGPGSSQPGSPFVASPSYMHSPGAMATPPPMSNAPSPVPYPNHIALPPNNLVQQPYINGNAHNNGLPLNHSMQSLSPGLTMPGRTPGTPPVMSPSQILPVPSQATTPLTPAPAPSPYATTNATLAPMSQVLMPTGAMGPPSKPAERPVKEVQYDVDDSLAGTGIDLREEEQFMAQFYAGSTRAEARTGFPANTPGAAGSMYGAGLANQPAQAISQDQIQFEVEQAKVAWQDAAAKLSVVRGHEVKNPFSNLAVLHGRAHRIANEYGLGLVLDVKNGGMGKMKLGDEFPEPSVDVITKVVGPDAVVSTTKSFLPVESFLAEQIGLLSIATKHRLRQLVEDADRVARTRQQTSHGVAPPEWVDVAVPIKTVDAGLALEMSSPAPGDEHGADPGVNPLKRSLDASESDPAAISASGKPATVVSGPGASFNLSAALRETSKSERDSEEARLRKRQKRAEDEERKKKGGDAAASTAGSRAGSVAPGTPGGADADAPPPVKVPTKKELKAKAAAAQKSLDSMNTATANSTTQHFLDSLSRKKKGKRTYSWMGAGAGSGASTPRGPGGTPATPGGLAAGAAAALGRNKVPEVAALTQDGRYRHGDFRENGEKGKNIQLRDWIQVLEREQHLEFRALQKAYLMLDSSAPK
ncbi:hypothetical protein GGTG_04618 [Gaeumannomyces tritici R3-111a-1]|uniref:Uncharacterized protein n=1 Tax=Gaeumannomyces tritici (strain R3-111a-1) TaxID=644352 RepID=J3NTL8_GAET3|nr:hypothetical protein GGTG_04618 [Gaeumannomyces tritici R3-111a-1]EJT79533.1 hypothetical protein GGTG_04618 [Gaeumannomyces tritici R3-111a-1]